MAKSAINVVRNASPSAAVAASYTVPAGKHAVVNAWVKITQTADTGSIKINGEYLILLIASEFAGNAQSMVRQGIVLKAGDVIQLDMPIAAAADAFAGWFGFEYDNSAGKSALNVTKNASTAGPITASYTVPAAKHAVINAWTENRAGALSDIKVNGEFLMRATLFVSGQAHEGVPANHLQGVVLKATDVIEITITQADSTDGYGGWHGFEYDN